MDKKLVPADYIAIGIVLSIVFASISVWLFVVLCSFVIVWAIVRVIFLIKGRRKNEEKQR